MSEYTQVVDTGARVLDKLNPGWFNEVDVDTLDLSSDTNCIGGQLYGTFKNLFDVLPGDAVRDVPAHGFVIGAVPKLYRQDAYQRLTEAWKGEIAFRREVGVLEAEMVDAIVG